MKGGGSESAFLRTRLGHPGSFAWVVSLPRLATFSSWIPKPAASGWTAAPPVAAASAVPRAGRSVDAELTHPDEQVETKH